MKDLTEAIEFAQSHEVPWTRDPAREPDRWGVHRDDPAPFNRLRGPVHERGGVSGVIRVRGEEVAAWGEPDRADLTFSVAKTYLALLAGIARSRGMLETGARVGEQLPGIGFDSAHNRAVTWDHLLTQTSEWEGTCFGMPDQVEHYRRVAGDPNPPGGRKGEMRPLNEPGSYWEYNDVRINQLSLALLHLFRRPLPEVFLDAVLRPLGGGGGFRWEGYDDAWVEIDGRRMQSVPGGSHWGAGVSISARDQARIAQLLLDGGAHRGTQPIPADWVREMQQPCAIAPFYGRLVWLNGDGRLFAHAPRSSWFMVGAGGNYVWIDPDHAMVAVVRWIDPAHAAGFVERLSGAAVALTVT
jgi:CubicO group peptidase (beta-lactamase class C family)